MAIPAFFLACDPVESLPGDGSGGAGAGTGAAPSSGGATTTGGAGNVGGTTSTGGSLSSGGSAGVVTTGGSSGSGGVSGSGGLAGGGGAAGGGGLAGGGGAAGSGGTSSAGFQPCPATGPCKILPLGDSITVGLGFDGGYRVQLFHLTREEEHEVTFTGSQPPNGPAMVDGTAFSRKHEGISGQTIDQIAARVPAPGFQDGVPHIILLHAGTNDMYQSPNGADQRLGALMDKLIEEAPDALIVVSNIIPFPQAKSTVDTFNATVPGMVKERADAGAHILFVDQFMGFPTSELGDGVHPNQAGYSRMAGKWYDAIKAYLP